eukprot:5450076-Amphidinium_carterae.1
MKLKRSVCVCVHVVIPEASLAAALLRNLLQIPILARGSPHHPFKSLSAFGSHYGADTDAT